ncbi:MAG: aminoacyl-tRNA deacylase [Nitrososphaeria archaeon]
MLDDGYLEDFLRRSSVSFEIVHHGHSYRADEASRELGIDLKNIVKTVLFINERGEPLIVVIRGDKRVNQSKLAKALGFRKLRLATPQELLDLTGYQPGALPPVGHKRMIRTIVDRDIMGLEYVYAGGGSVNSSLKISPRDIVRLQNAEVMDL